MGKIANNLIGMLRALGLFALSFHAGATEEPEGGWSDNLRSKEGAYAIRVDVAAGRVLVLRADDRAGIDHRYLRVRLLREGAALLLPLREASGTGVPRKYGAEFKSFAGDASAAELEASDDGKRWVTLGKFRKN